MSQVAKSASAFVRAFLAILVLELEDMVVRLVRPPKLAGFHGSRWTVRLGISVDVKRPADEISGWLLFLWVAQPYDYIISNSHRRGP